MYLVNAGIAYLMGIITVIILAYALINSIGTDWFTTASIMALLGINFGVLGLIELIRMKRQNSTPKR